MVHGEEKILAGALKISRSLITIVTGCQNSEMEGQVMFLPCKTGMGEYNDLILNKDAENSSSILANLEPYLKS